MSRSLACGVLFVLLRIAPLNLAPLAAQESGHWGDELPPAPEFPAMPVAPVLDAVGWPAPPLHRPPARVRAVYVNAWAFGGRRFRDLVALADRTEINSFVIDVKDDTGYLTYRSAVPTAIQIGANQQLRARDTEARLRILREHGIHPIARIVVAKDPLLASRKPEWSVRNVNGGLWRDRLDFAWVDAFNDSVWIYAAQLAAGGGFLGLPRGGTTVLRVPPPPPRRP